MKDAADMFHEAEKQASTPDIGNGANSETREVRQVRRLEKKLRRDMRALDSVLQ